LKSQIHQDLSKIVGAENIEIRPQKLEQRSMATFETNKSISIIVRATSTCEVSKILVYANEKKLIVHPISGGQNYGYGNSSPTQRDSILLDLSALKNISSYNSKQGSITVECGVTFRELHSFLTSKGNEYTIAGTGAPPEATLIGNLAERGIGKGLTGNRSDHVCSLEIVLPTGEIINTGMGKYNNSKVRELTKWGPGPQLDGLFIQSNLGIITKATFWLEPMPTHFQSFIFSIKNEEKLPGLIDALHRLKKKGVLKSNSAIFNDYRIIGALSQFPHETQNNQECLPRSVVQKELGKNLGKPAVWFGDGALYNFSYAQSKSERKIIQKELSPFVDTLLFFNKRNIKFYKLISKLLSMFNKGNSIVNLIDNFYEKSAYLGHPMEFTLASCYWRKKEPPKKVTPIKDNCGVYWLGPMVPFNSIHIKKATELIEKIMISYEFEPAMTLQLLTSRQIDIIISITYDRDIPGQDKKAKECHDELMQKLINEGYHPYRLGIQSYDLLPNSDDDTYQLLKKLKKQFDPNDVLSPGRYDFRNNWNQERSIKKVS
jgi:4-cresol dehydrogenase (hydroxylating)